MIVLLFVVSALLHCRVHHHLLYIHRHATLRFICVFARFGRTVASQAELDHFHYLQKQTSARVLRSCSGEMEREVHSILGPLGIKEPLSRLIAEDLRSVEEDVWGDRADEVNGTEGVVSLSPRKVEKKKWWKLSGGREEEGGVAGGGEGMGLTAFLLKFGEGLGKYIRLVSHTTSSPPSRMEL